MHATKKVVSQAAVSLFMLLVYGCSIAPDHSSPNAPLSWLEGCWQLDDKSIEENWVRSLNGDQLFGFSVNNNNGKRVFFEQLRIDLEPKAITFFAYPKGEGPTPFKGRVDGDSAIEFTNPDNDYPQRIRYFASGNDLAAEISLIDKSKTVAWLYKRCD